MRSLALSFVLSICAAGCSAGGDVTSGSTLADTAEAHVRFFSERDGFHAEVGSIVYSDQFDVHVDGLPPKTEVTLDLHSYVPGVVGRGYSSSATFMSDAHGVVSTRTGAALRGGYTGTDPDGLVWSATEGALAEGLGPDRTAAFVDVSVGAQRVASAALPRSVTTPDVHVTRVTDDGLVGMLYMPAGAHDRVPIVAYGGSEGGIGTGMSYGMRLASWGHPVLALAYFGAPGVPNELAEIPLEYFGKAFAYLDRRPETRHGKAIVIGGSRGGELSLLLGATFPNVAGVVAIVPSSYRWAGVTQEPRPAWTFHGQPLPSVPDSSAALVMTTTPTGAPAWVMQPWFEASLHDASAADLEAARIRAEDTNGPVLMIAGEDDQLWPSCDFANRAFEHLESSGHAAAHHDETVCLPGAGHAVVTPGMPMSGTTFSDLGDITFALGGSPGANARASRAADAKIKAFLATATR